MSINGVNNKLDIQKLLQQMKNGKAGKAGLSSKVPAHLTMNGSIFNAPNANNINLINNNKNGVSATRNNQTANNVLNANTAKSVSDVSKNNSSNKTEQAKANQETQNSDNRKVDIGNYDFDNLVSVPDGELNSLKSELTELKDSNLPRFLQNSVDSKLGKVNKEISKRASNVAGGEKKDEVKNKKIKKKAVMNL